MCTVADKAKSAEDATRPERQSAQGAVPISKIAVEHASRLPNRWVHRKARVNPNIEDVRKSAMKVSTKIVGSEKATQRSTSFHPQCILAPMMLSFLSLLTIQKR